MTFPVPPLFLAITRKSALSRLLKRLSCTLTAILGLGMLSPAAFAAWDTQQLMDMLAQHKSGRATFVETKHMALLDRPVESSGELFHLAPDRLEKHTFKPKPESMIVNGGDLLIERGRQKYHLQLQTYPELAAFIDSIRGTLSGDRKALERNYRLALEGTAERWILKLSPLDEKMQAVIKSIQITGARDVVRSIEMTQADGDRSVMVIETMATP